MSGRELSLAERPLTWLIERHAELLSLVSKGNTAPLFRMELESIEDEITDRADQGELRYDSAAMFKQVQEIILRGQRR